TFISHCLNWKIIQTTDTFQVVKEAISNISEGIHLTAPSFPIFAAIPLFPGRNFQLNKITACKF
ncbi:MAG: hypothetical protein WDZ72_09930, partial [Cyclobacteriaceae bacterium]